MDRLPPKRKRDININFRVSEDEKALIMSAVKASGSPSIREYLTGMATVGYVIQVDAAPLLESLSLLRTISNNVNQLARRANETRNIYAEDLEDLRHGYDAVTEHFLEAVASLEKLK